ncbi:MAG TPA: elongation factor G, partial [Dehalococcoidia bacterium]|nr:elongation factor G [Dehalococcoidia bacterium]
FRVYSGSFNGDGQYWNSNKSEAERVAQVFTVNGKQQEAVPGFAAGDIGAVAKLGSVVTGDTIAARDNPLILGGLAFPQAVYQMSVSPKTKADVDKMTSSLARITEEDPSLVVAREPSTLEVLLQGLGDTHLDVSIEKMKRKFGAELELQVPKVPYM